MTPTEGARIAGEIEVGQAERLAGILGLETPTGALPPTWHLAQLLDRRSRSELGSDGHPHGGVPTPPAEPHRRMFAGGRATHLAALRIGEPATRASAVVSTVRKEGRSGPLTIVTVRHDYTQAGELVVRDEHDLVYRPLPAPTSGPPAELAAPAEPETVEGDHGFDIDPVTLFLFSSATSNAHRIHYDLPFARSEGHTDLVVHGPLQVILMAGELVRRGVELLGRTLDYRLLAPAYGAQRLRVGSPAARDADVVVVDALGRRVARADVVS